MCIKQFICIAGFALFTLFCSAQIEDSFDNEIDNSWEGQIENWTIDNGELRSNGPAVTGTVLNLYRPVSLSTTTEWSFFANPKAATSSGNFMEVVLYSDTTNMPDNYNGYMIRIGGTPDNISLWKRSGENATVLIDGAEGVISSGSNNPMNIKATRSDVGEWNLFVDYGNEGVLNHYGSVMDNEHTAANYFAFVVQYSQANATKYYFDNLYVGPEMVDHDPPTIEHITVTNENTIQIQFSEAVEETSVLNMDHYSVTPQIDGIEQILLLSANEVEIQFTQSFENETNYTLVIENVSDNSGNITTVQDSFTYFVSSEFDILITEVMFDPSPVVGLPEVEYIEIHNRSNFNISLENWSIIDGTGSSQFGSHDIMAQQYLLLAKEDDLLLFETDNKIAFSVPSLTNSGETLALQDHMGNEIHRLAFNPNWHENTVKEDGGWSLEMIDTNAPCLTVGNWSSSTNSLGGTPGEVNSIQGEIIDNEEPFVDRLTFIDASSISLLWNETLATEVWTDINNYVLQPHGINPLEVIIGSESSQIILVFEIVFETNTEYELELSMNIEDCFGNKVAEPLLIIFQLPSEAAPFDIVINEILANPVTGNVDFIELYNRSDKVIDIQGMRIGKKDGTPAVLEAASVISASSYIVNPHEYVTLSKDFDLIKDQYYVPDSARLITVTDMIAFDDKNDIVTILNTSLDEIDEVSYSSSWHHPLLSSEDGVSLERISPDGPSNSSDNWHSAAAEVGYATPGYRNSQSAEQSATNNTFSLSNPYFSPNDDGILDFVLLQYNLAEMGYALNAYVYDERGRKIKHFVKNDILNTAGSYKWDGTDEDGTKAPIGIYTIYLELFQPDGAVEKERLSVNVVGKWN